MAAPSAVDELELVRRLRAEAGIAPTAVPDAPLQQVAQPAPMLPAAAKPDAELAMVAMLRRQAGIVPPEAMQPAAPLLAPATVPGMVQAQLPPITDKWFKKVFDRSGKFIGTPYVWGGNNEKGVDCSGFTCAAYKEVGVNLPRTAREQAKKGREVAWEDMQPGDALYFDMKGKGGVTHTGIYIGNGKMRHASSGQGRVTDVNLSGYWKKRTVTVRRFSGGDEPVSRETKQQEPPNIDSMIAEMRRRKAEVDALPVQTNASIKERMKVVKEINRLERRKREIASEPAAKALAEGFLSGGTLGAHQAFHKFATGVEKEESTQRFDALTEGAPTLRKGAEVSQAIAGAVKRKEKIQRMMKSSSDPTLAEKVKKIDAYIADLTPKRVQFGYLASNLPPLTEETLPQWDKRLKDLDTAHEVTLNARSKIKDKSSPRFKELDTRLGELKRLRANLWKQLPQSLRGKEPGWALAAKREQELQEIDVRANKGGKRIPYVSSFVGGAESVVEGVAPIMAGFWNLGLGKVFGEVDTREVGRAVASKQEARALKNPNIGEVLAGGLGSTLPLFLPGAAVGRTAKLGQWAKGSILGVSEASTNAGLHYSRLVGEGKPHSEALNVAVKQFVAEAPIDTIMARFGFFGKSPSGNFGQRLKGLAKNARPEAFQEGVQGFIADAAAGREFDPSSYTADGLIGYAVSFIIGAPALIAKNPGMEKRVGELMRSMEKQITAQAPAQPTKFVKTAPAGQALPAQIKPGKPPVAIPARGKPLTLPEQPKALPGAAPAKPAAPVTPMTEIEGRSVAPAVTATKKEPWQMTREEYSTKPTHPEGRMERIAAKKAIDALLAANAKKGMRENLVTADQWRTLQSKHPTVGDPTGDLFHTMDDPASRGKLVLESVPLEWKQHYSAVQQALASGKPVPAEVLADYPDLANQNQPSPAPESVVEQIEPVAPEKKQMGVPEPVEIKGGKPVAPERLGAKTKVKVPQMDDINVRYAVVDLKDLIISHDKNFNPNPKYAESLQPRDRTAANLKKQVEGIAKKFDPREVADSIHAATGAPIIDPETHIVEVGNGRLMAFKKAPVSKVKAYRDYLTKNAEKFGLTAEQIAAVKSPVLVRVRETAMTPEQRQEFTRRANEDIVAGESTADQAKTDTAALTDDVVNFLVENDLGDISNPQNSRFVSTFLDKLSVNTRADMLDPQGALSQQGIRRIEAAVLNKAYGSPKLTAKAFEDIDPNVKRILTGLKSAAPAYLKYRSEIDKGDAHNLDISTEIVDTVLLLDRLREQGMTPQDYIDQDAMFDTEADARAKEILGALAVKTPERGAIFDSAKRVREFIHNYVELARKQGKPSQGALVKGEAVKSKDVLIKQAADQVAGETASLFGMAEAVVEGTRPKAEPEPKTGFGESNTIVTKEEAEKAKDIIRKKLGGASSTPLDPETIAAGIKLATFYIEGGVRSFTEFSSKMISDMGERVAPYLRSWWEAAKHSPDVQDMLGDATGMARAFEDAERLARGQQTTKEAAQSAESLAELGKDLIESKSIDPQAVIDRAIKKFSGLSPEEVAAVVHYKRGLVNEARMLGEKLQTAQGPEKIISMTERLIEIDVAIDKISVVAQHTRTEWHDLGEALQIAYGPEYDFVSLKAAGRARNAGAPLTESVTRKLEEISKRVDRGESAKQSAREKLDAKMKAGEAGDSAAASKIRTIALNTLRKLGFKVADTSQKNTGGGAGKRKERGAVHVPSDTDTRFTDAVRKLAKSYIMAKEANDLDSVLDRLMDDMFAGANGFSREDLTAYLSGEYRQAKTEVDIAKRDADQIMRKVTEDAKRRQMSTARKIGQIALDVLHASREVKASTDISAPFIQGMPALLARPGTWAKAWGPMLTSFMGKDAFNRNQVNLRNKPGFKKSVNAGVEYTDAFGDFATQEEMLAGGLVDRLAEKKVLGIGGKVIKASGYGYISFLNELRYDLFRKMSKGVDDPAALRDIAMMVNVMTGRGWGKTANDIANQTTGAVFFAPRYNLSLFQHGLMAPVVTAKTAQGRVKILESYGRQLLTAAVGIGLLSLAGFDFDDDINSPSFGSFKTQDGRSIGIFRKILEPLRFLWQFHNGTNEKAANTYDNRGVFGGYIMNKLAPVPGLLVRGATGEIYDFNTGENRPLSWRDPVALYIPISIEQTISDFKTGKASPGNFILSITGINKFDEKGKKKGGRRPSIESMMHTPTGSK